MIKLPIACSILLALTVVKSRSIDDQWASWKVKHNKQYDIVEDQNEETKRRQIWQSRLDAVNEHNARFEAGLESYRKGLNQFSDMTWDELERTYLMSVNANDLKAEMRSAKQPIRDDVNDLPDSIDWREKGYVTSIKDQARCGSSWAYAAVGALEGQMANKTKKDAVDLSVQQLIDCNERNDGCRRGYPSMALYYTSQNGIESEADYPYKAYKEKCSRDDSKVAFKNDHYMYQLEAGEEKLTDMVALIGPTAVWFEVTRDFFEYESGVFTTDKCSDNRINYVLLVVGYGKEDGDEFWLIKNAWGDKWGDKGYVKTARNSDNMCSIASYPSVPYN